MRQPFVSRLGGLNSIQYRANIFGKLILQVRFEVENKPMIPHPQHGQDWTKSESLSNWRDAKVTDLPEILALASAKE